MNPSRILVVDDHASMLHSVERVLASRYHVCGVHSPSAALAALPSFRPDLALLDVQLPEMSGFELMKRLKTASSDLDVIFMTGSVNELDAQLVKAVEGGAFYFIQKPFDRKVLLALVDRCLELRRLAELNKHHTRRLERELSQARVFQSRLLPPAEARIAGLRIHARYVPCDELCGDFYDYAEVDADRAALLIADVSGHGVSAAMLTGMIKTAFLGARGEAFDPLIVIERIAYDLAAYGPRPFITAICARVVVRPAPAIEYVNAGHPPGVVWKPGGEMRLLESTGPLISQQLPIQEWELAREPLGKDDQLLLYTDGLMELSGTGEQFGTERVIEAATRQPIAGVALLDAVLKAAREHCGGCSASDDMTLLTASLDK